MRTCKNCQQPIKKNQRHIKCQGCNNPLHFDCKVDEGGIWCDVCYVLKGEKHMEETKITIPDVIRRTYIETYRTCPFKFLKEVIEEHKQPPTSYTQIGIDLHCQFEEACRGRADKESTTSIMKQLFESYPDSLFESGFKSDNREDMWKRTTDCIDTFFHNVLPSLPAQPFTTEETIHFSIGENLPLVEFTMDRIDEVDGELEIHDWKTGRVMVGQKLSSDLQAPLYIYGTREHFGKPVRRFTLYYLQENKTRTFERTDDANVYVCQVGKRSYYIDLNEKMREVQHVFSQIKNGNFNIPQGKSMHFQCKVCHLMKQGLCQGADMQSWQQAQEGKYSWT
jgi:hypothetical protein